MGGIDHSHNLTVKVHPVLLLCKAVLVRALTLTLYEIEQKYLYTDGVGLFVYLFLSITGTRIMDNTIGHVSLRERKKKLISYALLGWDVFSEFFFSSFLLKCHLNIKSFSA